MRAFYPPNVIGYIVSWIEEYLYSQTGMPESLDELFDKLPQHKILFESYQQKGFAFSYTHIDNNTMAVKTLYREDLYECKNNQNVFLFYCNNTLVREYARETNGIDLIYEKYYLPTGETYKVTKDDFKASHERLNKLFNELLNTTEEYNDK